MADRKVEHLLIGGGLASANCARWLREAGGDGSILLVGRESDAPYNRPPLTKKYLTGEETKEDTLFRPLEWYDEQKVELLLRTSVTQLDAESKTAKLSSGEQVAFETALIATGANVRRLRVDGCALDGLHYIRAFGNTDGIRRDLEERGKRIVCIGGSFIGTEVASSLTSHGAQSTIVMMEDVPFERTLGKELGGWAADVLREAGVAIHGGQTLARFESDQEGDDARVQRVVTEQGLTLDADLVVIGAGVTPDVSLATAAGLTIGEKGGILCDARLQSSVPGIYAAGDVCEYDSPLQPGTVRVEHWDAAFNQGKTAALNMLGQATEHTTVPYFWTHMADWFEIESVGPAYHWDEIVVRGSMDERDFSVWYLDGGKVAQVAAVNRGPDLETGGKLIAAQEPLADPAKLADEGFDPATLVG